MFPREICTAGRQGGSWGGGGSADSGGGGGGDEEGWGGSPLPRRPASSNQRPRCRAGVNQGTPRRPRRPRLAGRLRAGDGRRRRTGRDARGGRAARGTLRLPEARGLEDPPPSLSPVPAPLDLPGPGQLGRRWRGLTAQVHPFSDLPRRPRARPTPAQPLGSASLGEKCGGFSQGWSLEDANPMCERRTPPGLPGGAQLVRRRRPPAFADSRPPLPEAAGPPQPRAAPRRAGCTPRTWLAERLQGQKVPWDQSRAPAPAGMLPSGRRGAAPKVLSPGTQGEVPFQPRMKNTALPGT